MSREKNGKRTTETPDTAERRYRLAGSLAAKAAAFILLAVFSLGAAGSLLICIYMGARGYYSLSSEEVLDEELYQDIYEVTEIVRDYLEQGDVNSAETLCREADLDMQLVWLNGDDTEMEVWNTWKYDGEEPSNVYTEMPCSFKYIGRQVSIEGHQVWIGRRYLLRVYADTNFPRIVVLGMSRDMAALAYRWKYALAGLCAGCVTVSILCFAFLLYGAGRRKGREGIVPGGLTRLPVDVLTLLFVGIGAGVVFFALYMGRYDQYRRVSFVFLSAAGMTEVLLLNRYCADLVIRVKRGRWWRHMLVFVVPGKLWRGFLKGVRGFVSLIGGMPRMLIVLSVYFILCILEYVGLGRFLATEKIFILWGLDKVILLIVILYISWICRKMLEAGRALAQGEEDYRINTFGMLGSFREHGENLNSVGQGIAKAVAERMKSEHLKTELISNVSHDLKTPLTSIINYADLICGETGASGETTPEKDARIQEYSEVLLRQSRRLKKLLEDLIEASKATTGNLEVNLQPCEVGVLLSQAVGEYQQKMEEKELQLIARQPEQPVNIVADGRHLWRVFDNLLNNICKYAQEHSRVYLSVEAVEGYAVIIFRNMSKYPLDISPEELEERFVRGDKSRHMEGNGLGLSIAKSLMELQNGKMEIVTDGDLFKVILRFPEYLQENAPEASPEGRGF